MTKYTAEDLKKEAKDAAVHSAKLCKRGRPFGIVWTLVLEDGQSPCLVVSYAANGAENALGVYHVNVAI